MSLLDELKSERSQQEQEAAAIAEAARKKNEFYEHHLNPRMKKLYMYLYELCDHLKALDQKITATYYYPGIGAVDGFSQTDYRISVNSAEQMKKIQLQFQCTRDNSVKIITDAESNGPTLEDFLKSHHISYLDRKVRPDGMHVAQQQFEFVAQVDAEFEFLVDMESMTIEFAAYNFPDWGAKRLSFKPHELNADVMDKLGRFLLRQENTLFETKLSEEARLRIRQLTEEAEKKRKKDNMLAKLYSPGQETPRLGGKNKEKQQAKKGKSLLGRLLKK